MRRRGRGRSWLREKHMPRLHTWASGLRPPAPSFPGLSLLEKISLCLAHHYSYPLTGNSSSQLTRSYPPSQPVRWIRKRYFILFYVFIYLAGLGLRCTHGLSSFSSAHGILVPRDRIRVSDIGRWIFNHWTTRGVPGNLREEERAG